MELYERNHKAMRQMAKRLLAELQRSLEDARAAGDKPRAVQLESAFQAVMTIEGALTGHLVSGRRSGNVHDDDWLSVDELAELLWDSLKFAFEAGLWAGAHGGDDLQRLS